MIIFLISIDLLFKESYRHRYSLKFLFLDDSHLSLSRLNYCYTYVNVCCSALLFHIRKEKKKARQNEDNIEYLNEL